YTSPSIWNAPEATTTSSATLFHWATIFGPLAAAADEPPARTLPTSVDAMSTRVILRWRVTIRAFTSSSLSFTRLPNPAARLGPGPVGYPRPGAPVRRRAGWASARGRRLANGSLPGRRVRRRPRSGRSGASRWVEQEVLGGLPVQVLGHDQDRRVV